MESFKNLYVGTLVGAEIKCPVADDSKPQRIDD